MKKRISERTGVILMALLSTIGCSGEDQVPPPGQELTTPPPREDVTGGAAAPPTEQSARESAAAAPRSDVTKAVAVLHPTKGNNARGTVTMTKEGEGVKIVADIEGLSPGDYGFHVHEFGDCSADDATSAGDHYDPEGSSHGGPDDEKRHVGDLGNVTANAEGEAHYERTDKVIALDGEHSVIGLAFVVHTDRDDLKSQPTGDAGGRLACGVMGIAERE